MSNSSADSDSVTAAALLWSQQDYDEHWRHEQWPSVEEGLIECANPQCSAPGFERTRLIATVIRALESGTVAAGAIRCEGLDRANVTPCTNALVYLLEED